MRLASKLKSVTERLFTKHLFITNTSLGIAFLGAGDAIQQTIERKLFPSKIYEPRRTGNMMISGCGFGFLGHLWYKMLDTKFPGKAVKTVCKKMVAEMAIGPPVLFGFFLVVGFLEGKRMQTSIDGFKKNIFIILAADWAVYAPLQAVNFFFVPPKYRFLYVCALSLAYDIFLSFIIHREDNKKLQAKKT